MAIHMSLFFPKKNAQGKIASVAMVQGCRGQGNETTYYQGMLDDARLFPDEME